MSPESSSRGSERKKHKQKKGNTEHKNPKKEAQTGLKEASLIKISQILEKFRESDMEVYTFDACLQNLERKAVHTLCRKMGMKSKSHGKGEQRRVSVYKTEKTLGSKEAKKELLNFGFSEESKGVLQDLFSRCPPNDGEMSENKFGESSGNPDYVRNGDDMFRAPSMNTSEIASKVQKLALKIKKSQELQKIEETRSKLPIASFRDDITSMIESNQVVLICGETGCGKTTQVPQFLLDHAWNKGQTCKIVCTQPRRISAISVAERIASERGETVGDSIGYKIRLESKGGRHSSIVFCTNGVLLKVLLNKGSHGLEKKSKRKHNGVSGITHIIVDEIHERDRFSDFILAILRDLLPSYPHLRLVMMSATIDAERFSQYFGGSPILRVPGLTYPVKTFYLEDVLAILGSTGNNHVTSTESSQTIEESILSEDSRAAFDEAIDLALSEDEFEPLLELLSSEGDPRIFNHQHSQSGLTPLMVFSMKGRVGDICMLLSLGVDCNLRCNAGKTALDYAQSDAAEIIKTHMEKSSTDANDEQKLLDKYISKANPELVDCVLIEQLLVRLCNDSKEGAILVFLPGWDDITSMRNRLLANRFFNNPSKFCILSLHSMVPSSEQKKVFNRPPHGSRKIVLSTNIAETSVTIDDVVYVVDSGRMKEKSYDPYNNVSTLHSSWISRASAKQREGRAGRCQPGVCYHMYSKHREASLTEFQIPEIKRMPIEELCLQVRLLDRSCKIEDFLQKLLDPPVHETIRNGILFLQEIGALTHDEKLTDLGEKLGSLPVHPQTSKMLLVAILLNCLDPALTLACASEYRDPFILPINPEDKNIAETARFELASLYSGRGDQLAVIAAFEYWRMAMQKGEEGRFCSKFFISSNTMRLISGMRNQLLTELVRCGLIQKDTSHCSLNAQDPGIVHAVVASGLYPMIGRTISVGKRFLIETGDGNKVRLHQRSAIADLLGKIKDSNPPLVAFDEITRGDGGMYIRKCSLLGSLPLLLLSTDFVVAPLSENDDNVSLKNNSDCEEESDDSGEKDKPENPANVQQNVKVMSSPENVVKIVVDRWLAFESMALDAAQIYCLRERLSAAVLHKVTYPDKVLPPHLGQTIHAIACILSFDGVSEISSILNSANAQKGNDAKVKSSFKSYLNSLRNQNSVSHTQEVNSPIFVDPHSDQRPVPRYNLRSTSSSLETSTSHKVSRDMSKRTHRLHLG